MQELYYQHDTVVKLQEAGYNITQLVSEVNSAIPSPFNNDTSYPFQMAMYLDMDIIASGLRVRAGSLNNLDILF